MLAIGFAAPALAQQPAGARVTFGLGAQVAPAYFGSDDYEIGPSGFARFDFVRLPGGLEFGSTRAVGYTEGFGLRGAARYIGSRKASDNSELQGLDNVDAAMELGFGLGYDTRDWRAFGDVRYGFVGHNSWVGQLGADAVFRPNDALVVNLGPRVDFGSERFIDTYFGVTGSEAAASDFAAFDPSGGLVSVGLELGARYAFSENWGVEGTASYGRLIEDAADSPITELGSADQYGLSVQLTRSISLGF